MFRIFDDVKIISTTPPAMIYVNYYFVAQKQKQNQAQDSFNYQNFMLRGLSLDNDLRRCFLDIQKTKWKEFCLLQVYQNLIWILISWLWSSLFCNLQANVFKLKVRFFQNVL